MIYPFIYKQRFQYRVEKMCTILKVSKSGYYKWIQREPSAREKRLKVLEKQIRSLFNYYKKRAGSPTITEVLRKKGVAVSSKTVSRLMRKLGLKSITVRKIKATTNSKHHLPVYDNVLNRQFKALAPNKAWVTDITYIATGEGWLYLASVMDLYSRKIVGFAMGARMTRELVLDALEKAYKRRKPAPGLIHHSDRGSQYACHEYRKKLQTYQMIGSMSRKGNCYDNACIESFHSTLKKEFVYQTKFKTRKQAMRELYAYIEFDYNRLRAHSTLGYESAHHYEQLYYKSQSA
ncbi:IS3 family transposase [Paenibacillus sp. LMG 31458]|uniref:IS3 family transposase n=1 Tax=Paenibacillus phytorum TaxID=2654977 RepID=A0ABX1Y027_9BACL|nr:IS3 family transposase [Paenibacillus phytorum]